MATLSESFVDLPTTRGAMRVNLFIPDGGGKHPGIIFYSETGNFGVIFHSWNVSRAAIHNVTRSRNIAEPGILEVSDRQQASCFPLLTNAEGFPQTSPP